jgi:hypothetical protein
MSVSRQCLFMLATDAKWYMQLGNHEYAYDDWNSTWYGPFDSQELADQYLYDNFDSTSGAEIDDRSNKAPPVDVERPLY